MAPSQLLICIVLSLGCFDVVEEIIIDIFVFFFEFSVVFILPELVLEEGVSGASVEGLSSCHFVFHL